MRLTDKEVVDTFFNECRNYSRNKKQLSILKNKLLEINTARYGVQAVKAKEVIIENHQMKGFDYELMEEADKVKVDIFVLEMLNKKVDYILSQMDKESAEMIRRIYIKGEIVEKVADDHYITRDGLYKKIRKEAVKALSK